MSFGNIKLPDENDLSNTFILFLLKAWDESGLIELEYNNEKDVYIIKLNKKEDNHD